jgi:hypothetical protein
MGRHQKGYGNLDKDKEYERFSRWAKELGLPEFNAAAFDDLVMLNGLRSTVEELEDAFLGIQRGGFLHEVSISGSRCAAPRKCLFGRD